MNHLLPLATLRVLVVEDDPDSRELMVFILEPAGAQVTAVASGQAAFEAVTQQSFDLIISDLQMPERDGYSLIREIRSLQPEQGGQTPAIALSGSVREEERELAFTCGFQRFLLKPIDPDELINVIVALLNQPNT
jgi:CheY-like chemotaxis protein